jgi:hypothetical protein
MSYTMNGYGAYYEYSPHEVFSGYGAYYEYSPHEVFSGYGATDTAAIRKSFNATEVWAQAQLGGSCYTPGNPMYDLCSVQGQNAACAKCNAAGGKASDQIRRGLVELGYADDLTTGVMWGGADEAAWKAFTADQSLPAGPGLVNKVGIDRMGELLHAGEAPGPTGKAGMGKIGWLLVAGAIGVAAVAVMAGKKRRSGAASGRAMVPVR